MTYNFSEHELSDIHINVEKLKQQWSEPPFTMTKSLDTVDSFDAKSVTRATSMIPTNEHAVALKVIHDWFANFLANEPVEALNRLLTDGTYKWDDLKKCLSAQKFDIDKVCKTFVCHIDDPDLHQYYTLEHLLPDPQPVQTEGNAAKLRTIRTIDGTRYRKYWVPLEDAYSDQLDRLFAEAERIGLPTEEIQVTKVGPTIDGGADVAFWFENGKEPRALWWLGPTYDARRFDGHWYLSCTPDDDWGREPEVEMADAIMILDEIAAFEQQLKQSEV
jgi:hypothetical protein